MKNYMKKMILIIEFFARKTNCTVSSSHIFCNAYITGMALGELYTCGLLIKVQCYVFFSFFQSLIYVKQRIKSREG